MKVKFDELIFYAFISSVVTFNLPLATTGYSSFGSYGTNFSGY